MGSLPFQKDSYICNPDAVLKDSDVASLNMAIKDDIIMKTNQTGTCKTRYHTALTALAIIHPAVNITLPCPPFFLFFDPASILDSQSLG